MSVLWSGQKDYFYALEGVFSISSFQTSLNIPAITGAGLNCTLVWALFDSGNQQEGGQFSFSSGIVDYFGYQTNPSNATFVASGNTVTIESGIVTNWPGETGGTWTQTWNTILGGNGYFIGVNGVLLAAVLDTYSNQFYTRNYSFDSASDQSSSIITMPTVLPNTFSFGPEPGNITFMGAAGQLNNPAASIDSGWIDVATGSQTSHFSRPDVFGTISVYDYTLIPPYPSKVDWDQGASGLWVAIGGLAFQESQLQTVTIPTAAPFGTPTTLGLFYGEQWAPRGFTQTPVSGKLPQITG